MSSTEKEKPMLPEDCYGLLNNIGKRIMQSSDGHYRIQVQKEEVCEETGGSCMDLEIRYFPHFDGYHEVTQAHVTDKNLLARYKFWQCERVGPKREIKAIETQPPNFQDVINTVKEVYIQQAPQNPGQ